MLRYCIQPLKKSLLANWISFATRIESRIPPKTIRVGVLLMIAGWCWSSIAAESPGGVQFRKEVQPILTEYCYDCHADGANKGDVAFDEFTSDRNLLEKRDLWWNVLKNVRAGIMPPDKKSRPTPIQKQKLEAWIKRDVF